MFLIKLKLSLKMPSNPATARLKRHFYSLLYTKSKNTPQPIRHEVSDSFATDFGRPPCFSCNNPCFGRRRSSVAEAVEITRPLPHGLKFIFILWNIIISSCLFIVTTLTQSLPVCSFIPHKHWVTTVRNNMVNNS